MQYHHIGSEYDPGDFSNSRSPSRDYISCPNTNHGVDHQFQPLEFEFQNSGWDPSREQLLDQEMAETQQQWIDSLATPFLNGAQATQQDTIFSGANRATSEMTPVFTPAGTAHSGNPMDQDFHTSNSSDYTSGDTVPCVPDVHSNFEGSYYTGYSQEDFSVNSQEPVLNHDSLAFERLTISTPSEPVSHGELLDDDLPWSTVNQRHQTPTEAVSRVQGMQHMDSDALQVDNTHLFDFSAVPGPSYPMHIDHIQHDTPEFPQGHEESSFQDEHGWADGLTETPQQPRTPWPDRLTQHAASDASIQHEDLAAQSTDRLSPPSAPTTSTPSNYIKCPYCPALFKEGYGRGNMGRHIRHKHKNGIRYYTCKVEGCGKVFQRNDAVLKHYRRRHPELPVAPRVRSQGSASVPAAQGDGDFQPQAIAPYQSQPQPTYHGAPASGSTDNNFSYPPTDEYYAGLNYAAFS